MITRNTNAINERHRDMHRVGFEPGVSLGSRPVSILRLLYSAETLTATSGGDIFNGEPDFLKAPSTFRGEHRKMLTNIYAPGWITSSNPNGL
jgi:hypothetical protein